MTRVLLILTLLTTVISLLGGFQLILHEWRALRKRRRMTGRWFALVTVVLFRGVLAAEAEATACSGSGLAYTCGPTATNAQVQAAIDASTDEAVITFTAGTYSNITGITTDSRNGVTLRCETEGACIIPSTSINAIQNTICAATRTHLFRVTGFAFTGNPATVAVWMTCGTGNSYSMQVRVDHNDFQLDPGAHAIWTGNVDPGANGLVYGVIDHNYCHATENFLCFEALSGGITWSTGTQGTATGIYFEDNRCIFTTRSNFGSTCVDGWHANSIVVRFNTVIGTLVGPHGYCHEGPQSFEAYGNTIDTSSVASPGFWDLHIQGGGEAMVWGNTLTAGASFPFVIQHYRADSSTLPEGLCNSTADGTVTGTGASAAFANDGNRSPAATYRGYPAWHQPGRDGAATLKPMYMWNNLLAGGSTLAPFFMATGTWTGLAADCANTDTARINCHIQLNRDVYKAVSSSAQSSATSPFNGTVGMGFGTLANRPTTCTPTPEALDTGAGGVGYWATDQGSWNQSSSNPWGVQQSGADGVLYRCSATDTWTVAYTPYIYPHPLQGFIAASPVDTRLYLRFMEVLLLAASCAWKFRAPLLAGVLVCAQVTQMTYQRITRVLPEVAQRTAYVSRVGAAKVLLTVLPRKPQ